MGALAEKNLPACTMNNAMKPDHVPCVKSSVTVDKSVSSTPEPLLNESCQRNSHDPSLSMTAFRVGEVNARTHTDPTRAQTRAQGFSRPRKTKHKSSKVLFVCVKIVTETACTI